MTVEFTRGDRVEVEHVRGAPYAATFRAYMGDGVSACVAADRVEGSDLIQTPIRCIRPLRAGAVVARTGLLVLGA